MVEVHIAQNIAGRETLSLHLIGVKHFPLSGTLEDCAKLHKEDAKKVFKALTQSLAGGTVDALIVELLRHKLSLLVVPEEDHVVA